MYLSPAKKCFSLQIAKPSYKGTSEHFMRAYTRIYEKCVLRNYSDIQEHCSGRYARKFKALIFPFYSEYSRGCSYILLGNPLLRQNVLTRIFDSLIALLYS